MQGLGFFIWNLETIKKFLTPEQLADLLKQTRTGWVSIKIADGELPFNQIGGNDKVLLDYQEAISAAGVEWGGWAYAYPLPTSRANVEAGLYGERVQKLKLEHLMIDAEAEWKKTNLGGQIDKLCYIDVSKKFPIGLTSYRYPSMHQEFNWPRWMKQTSLKFMAPQVYWLGSNDAADQLKKSYDEYKAMTELPFIPIGATFGVTLGAGSSRHWWEPSIDELIEFVEVSRELNCPAFGFWSLDWILQHNKYDWLKAISGVDVQPPGPLPEPLPKTVTVKTDKVNIRNAATTAGNTRVGTLLKGASLPVTGEAGDWWEVKLWVSKTVVK